MLSFYQQRHENYTSKISTNNSYPAHLHRQVELVYVTEGSIEVTIDGIDYNLSKGDVSICFPNRVHNTNTPENSSAIFLIFDVEFVSDFSKEFVKMRPECPVIKASDIPSNIVDCILQLNEHYQTDGTDSDSRVARGLFYILLGNLLPKLNLVMNRGSKDLNTCQQILIYIDENYTKDLTLDSLSATLNISKFYISHLFTSKVKISFPSYLNDRRIRLAMHLLKSTDQSVTDVCYNSGFNSSRTFYRVFKDSYGITPLQYRNSL